MFGEEPHAHHQNPDQLVELVEAATIHELVKQLPEELAAIAIWLDARNEQRTRHLEDMMSQLSEEIAAVKTAVQSAKDRVSAEIADLETKIADPETTVTAADLDGLKGIEADLNSLAAPSDAETATPSDGVTQAPSDTPADAGTPDTANVDGGSTQA